MSHETVVESSTPEVKKLEDLSPRALAFADSFPWNHVYYGKKLHSPLSPPKKLLLLALLKINEHLPPSKKGSRTARNADATYNKSCRLTVAEMTECINDFFPETPIEHHMIHSFVSKESIKLVQNYSQRLNVAIQAELGRFKYGKTDRREDFDRLFTEALALAVEAYKIHKARIILPKNIVSDEVKSEKNNATQKRLQRDRRSTHNNAVDERSKRILVPHNAPSFSIATDIHDIQRHIEGDASIALPVCFSISREDEVAFYVREIKEMVPGVRIDLIRKLLKTKETQSRGDISWMLAKGLEAALPKENIIFADELRKYPFMTALVNKYARHGTLAVDVCILRPTWTGTGTHFRNITRRILIMQRETALARRTSAVPV